MLTEPDVVEQLTRFYLEIDQRVDELVPVWRPETVLRRRHTSWQMQLLATAALLALVAGIGFLIREARLFRTISPVTSPAPHAGSPRVLTQDVPLQPIGVLSSTQAWAVSNDVLQVTDNGGRTWKDITPTGAVGSCCAVSFLDRLNGWAGGGWSVAPPGLKIFRTQDGGATWVKAGMMPSADAAAGPPVLDFVDRRNGWLLTHDFANGGSLDVGVLFRTTDGGATWIRLPVLLASPVPRPFIRDIGIHFVDSLTGWLVASDTSGRQHLYLTHDGGSSWAPQTLPAPARGLVIYPGLPARFGSRIVEPATLQDGRVFVDTSADGGLTWKTDRSLSPVSPGAGNAPPAPGYQAPTFVADRVIALAVGDTLAINDGKHWSAVHPVGLRGAIYVEFADPRVGWALTLHSCGDVCGVTQYELLKTTDGGRTWFPPSA